MPEFSIVIPCRNEQDVIKKTLFQIIRRLKKFNFEIIVIDDNSSDLTYKITKTLSKKSKKIKVFKNKNQGLGPAINLAIAKSRGKYLCIMMSDLSDSLNDLIKYFINIRKNNYDAVFGSRFIKNSKIIDYPIRKLILNRIFNLFVKLFFKTNLNDFTNAFKIYKKSSLLKILPIVSENFNVFLELPLKFISRNMKYKIIPIKWQNRKVGKSKFKIHELRSKYLFTLLFCYFEKILIIKS